MALKNLVVVCDSGAVSGGAEKIALLSALEMRRRGVNVYFFCGRGEVDERLPASGVKVISTGQTHIARGANRAKSAIQGLWNRKARGALERLLAVLDPAETAVHFHGWMKVLSPFVFQATKARRFPVLITVHEYFLSCPNGGFYDYRRERICRRAPLGISCTLCHCDKRSYGQKLWRVLRGHLQNRFIRGNDMHVAFISDLSREVIEPHLRFPCQKHELPNFFEARQNAVHPLEGNAAFLYIGRLSAEKGAELFCQALSELGLPGILIGDGALRAELAAKYPNLTFTGWLRFEEMPKYAHRCRGLVLPSKWYEGSPLVVPEVQGSFHMPCIVPDRCAARAFIEEGRTGLLFQSGDLQDLKRALLALNRPGEARRMQAEIAAAFRPEAHHLSTHIPRLNAIYQRMLS